MTIFFFFFRKDFIGFRPRIVSTLTKKTVGTRGIVKWDFIDTPKVELDGNEYYVLYGTLPRTLVWGNFSFQEYQPDIGTFVYGKRRVGRMEKRRSSTRDNNFPHAELKRSSTGLNGEEVSCTTTSSNQIWQTCQVSYRNYIGNEADSVWWSARRRLTSPCNL